MRVLLADDHTAVRWALRTVINEQTGLLLVGEVSRTADLLPQARALQPDLILLEWELLGRVEDNLLADLHRLKPETRVIILSRRPELQKAALAAGADAFASKADSPEQLLATLHRLVADS
jgi:DNA-binding NarL/FixJ family response regulator